MQKHDIRGRGFNHFWNSGYLLHRFWPEEDRLPFMDIHQAGTADDRAIYPFALIRKDGWDRLDSEYHFDWALLTQGDSPTPTLPDLLDNDSTGTWLMVFNDDAASLYVRRGGSAAAAIDSFALPVERGLAARAAEAARVGLAQHADAERIARRSRAADPRVARHRPRARHARHPRRHGRALRGGVPASPDRGGPRTHRTRRAREARHARAAPEEVGRGDRGLRRRSARAGQARAGAFPPRPRVPGEGDRTRAREEYAAEVRTNPWNAEARDSLAALGGPR